MEVSQNTKAKAKKTDADALKNDEHKTAVTASKFKRKLTGVVISNNCEKTLVVKVERRFRHGKYNKFVHSAKKYYVHDPDKKGEVGNTVTIIESRPHSHLKRWELLQITK